MSNPLLSPAKAFVGEIEATPVTAKYKLGLILVAFGMVLLLAVYFGLILLMGYGLYYHLAHLARIMDAASRDFFTFFGSLAVPVCGLIIIFFMFKPFLAGRPPEPDRYTLLPQSDPELFAVIARICELVKAPLPSRVDVDCRVNASVHFRNGWRGMKDNDVVLTIGLPLVAGLTMQEFVGVLAHEFGHFRQGAGMRFIYVIRATNQWFARVVYERDDWDIRLIRAAHGIDIRIGIFLHLTRFCIWLSRRVLWLLMHVGHMVSGFMLRQMEFDADSYEAKVAGSNAFAQTMAKIQALGAAFLLAHRKMEESWHSHRLPEDMVRFICSIRHFPPALQKQLDEAEGKDKTGLFDTHPCSAARVRASAAMNQPGVFHLTEPASRLFNGFTELCKGATRFYYESNLALRIRDGDLVPNETSEQETQYLAEGESALSRFLCGLRPKYRPILISGKEPASATAAELAQHLNDSRQAMEQSAPETLKANREYEEAEALYQRGLNALKHGSQTATERADSLMRQLAPTLALFEGHAQTRLTDALLLLHFPETARNLADIEKLQSEADQLMVVFRGIGEVFLPLQELRRKTEALAAALHARSEPSLTSAAQVRMTQLEPELRGILKELKQRLNQVPYPYPHRRQGMTLEEFARSDFPADHKLEALYNDCASHVNRLLQLYHRVFGRLAFLALKVEETCLHHTTTHTHTHSSRFAHDGFLTSHAARH